MSLSGAMQFLSLICLLDATYLKKSVQQRTYQEIPIDSSMDTSHCQSKATVAAQRAGDALIAASSYPSAPEGTAGFASIQALVSVSNSLDRARSSMARDRMTAPTIAAQLPMAARRSPAGSGAGITSARASICVASRWAVAARASGCESAWNKGSDSLLMELSVWLALVHVEKQCHGSAFTGLGVGAARV
ncbi:hypothetical protein KHC28_06815, partial [Ancylobacter sonchi]|uniref:hypothetical protein n=1 Tax=Ancylobacter sonchi TaxID=1937790 RepID=UPI001BD4AA3C|nr:hypothetical protein [Ancylobacter sonchi]